RSERVVDVRPRLRLLEPLLRPRELEVPCRPEGLDLLGQRALDRRDRSDEPVEERVAITAEPLRGFLGRARPAASLVSPATAATQSRPRPGAPSPRWSPSERAKGSRPRRYNPVRSRAPARARPIRLGRRRACSTEGSSLPLQTLPSRCGLRNARQSYGK